MAPSDLLKTQIECHHGNHQSKRQKPKIQKKAHQSTVLRSLQIVMLSLMPEQRTDITEAEPLLDEADPLIEKRE
ncbi:hypothetical protein [Acetobacter oryzoeni]|uniref:Uncharacterized protein n=1 Tax=Acetobacter oryzoeni TaxID=2500548 RepID=A0A5B9GHH0_9PROT|nr:hypothetical protein [Acetobacter oryzoeni]MCP1202021.1 hypothetical protein [Acetobacter oryzoeni]QEE85738.1 hypothetical protein EOV40_008460 [Acetobacter oryzoeni]